MSASYPSAVKTFALRSPGQTIAAAHIDDLQDEVHAIEDGLLNGTAPLISSAASVASLQVAGGSTFAGSVSFAGSPTFAAPVVFSSAVTVSTGTLTLGQGQIVFPATQVASAGANTLDDYEEGSWTPVLGGAGGTSGQTYTNQLGRYVKVGKIVHVSFFITLSAKGTITGALQVQGLPFAAGASVGATVALPYYVSLNTSWVSLGAIVFGGTSALSVYGNTAAAATVTALATGDVTNTTELQGSLTYIAGA